MFWFFSFSQLVKAPSLSEGLRQLQMDNKTESVNTINILHRWDFWQSILHISFCLDSNLSELKSSLSKKENNFVPSTGLMCTKRSCWRPSTRSTRSGSIPSFSTPMLSSPSRSSSSSQGSLCLCKFSRLCKLTAYSCYSTGHLSECLVPNKVREKM